MELATPEQVSISSGEDFFSLFSMLAQPYSQAHFHHLYEIVFILQVNKANILQLCLHISSRKVGLMWCCNDKSDSSYLKDQPGL